MTVDSEVRQKFEARKWCDEHRKHPIIGKAIQGAQSWQPDGLAEIVAYIQDEAYSAGMRAGEIARWIPVEEKLPEITTRFGPGNCYGESDEVLAYSGHICTAVKHASGTWATIEGSNLRGVTHWQPLPAAPEEKKGGTP